MCAKINHLSNGNSSTSQISCPVCGSNGKTKFLLSDERIKCELSSYFQQSVPDDLLQVDYELIQCQNCTLEFASPLIPGNDSFYKWITQQNGYYPKSRWEWKYSLDYISNCCDDIKALKILDVGCGNGDFLRFSNQQFGINVVGLDTTRESIDNCCKQGFEAYCTSLDEFRELYFSEDVGFDCIVSFHCLEHVSKPQQFVESMLALLKPEGRLLISTPYSPMSFETDWFDVLNHPPHHLLRWNIRAYEALAQQLNCQLKVFMPQSPTALTRTTVSWRLIKFGRVAKAGKLALILSVLKSPVQFFKLWLNQIRRHQVNGKTASDTILIELRRR